ncbi:hypothetical protein HA402_010622 [Bradysia odoriphaga]|nr:hypothetical protein HA402_010622 [Bradysia odoriphaga]
MSDYLELVNLTLDDAMIQYAYIGYDSVDEERAWKEFKYFYNCEEGPADLFAKFWNVIMPNISNYPTVQNVPFIAIKLSWIYNPRSHPPPSPQPHDNVKKISLIQFKKQQDEAMQRKMLYDPKLLQFQAYCLAYINERRAMQQTQPETNQVSTNLGSLRTVDHSAFDQLVRPSSRDSRIGGTSLRVIQHPTTSTPLPGASQLTMGQSFQPSSSHSTIRRGQRIRLNPDSISQSSTSEIPNADFSENTSESEGETPRQRRRRADIN